MIALIPPCINSTYITIINKQFTLSHANGLFQVSRRDPAPDLRGTPCVPRDARHFFKLVRAYNREASPVLYSCNNRFGFYYSYEYLTCTVAKSPKSAVFTSFLSRIGHQNTNFLRHICIDSNFPTVNNVVLQGDNLELLELIREKCTGIAILEISPRT